VKGGGLMAELGGMAESDDDLEDYDDDLAPPEDDGSNAAFDTYAETALGSSDPAKLAALKEAIRACMEEYGPGAVDALEGL